MCIDAPVVHALSNSKLQNAAKIITVKAAIPPTPAGMYITTALKQEFPVELACAHNYAGVTSGGVVFCRKYTQRMRCDIRLMFLILRTGASADSKKLFLAIDGSKITPNVFIFHISNKLTSILANTPVWVNCEETATDTLTKFLFS